MRKLTLLISMLFLSIGMAWAQEEPAIVGVKKIPTEKVDLSQGLQTGYYLLKQVNNNAGAAGGQGVGYIKAANEAAGASATSKNTGEPQMNGVTYVWYVEVDKDESTLITISTANKVAAWQAPWQKQTNLVAYADKATLKYHTGTVNLSGDATPNAGSCFISNEGTTAFVHFSGDYLGSWNDTNQNSMFMVEFYKLSEADLAYDGERNDYVHNISHMNRGDRGLTSFTITDGEKSLKVSGIQTSAQAPVYVDKIAQKLTTKQGATLKFTDFNYTGSWMHAYAYIDYNNDFEFNLTNNNNGEGEGEIVSYNYYDGNDITGTSANQGSAIGQTYGESKAKAMPAFTLPRNLPAGEYRMRVKVDWNNLDADYGASDIAANGGCQCDITIVIPAAAIGDKYYASLSEALEAAQAMTGDVTVEILDKVTFNQPLIGSYSSINFVGKAENAEMYLDVQGYTTATGKEVTFTDLKLSKSEDGFVTNAGFMNVAFGIYDVEEVTYTNCTFENGACASSGKVTFNGCTFKKSWDKYGLWAYGNVDVTVQGSTFADYRGIKMYSEDHVNRENAANLTVKNTDFSAADNKPAIVLTYGESVTLENNTYNTTQGVFELDLDGKPNGVAVTSEVLPTCKNDNGPCGVLVDGKIYTTVAQAAEVATSGSNVTLLHSSTENVEFAFGVNLDKNNFVAETVTVAQPVAKIGEQGYATLAEALTAAANNATVELLWAEGDAPIAMNGAVFGKNVTIKGNATVDWSKGHLFVGRGGEGNATVTFDGANLTSASDNASYGIHVSGRENGTNNKYDGTLVIRNSTVELDYLINRNTIELDNATLTVKNGFGIAGRPASETESGANATATISLANNSKVVVNNHNGMGLGQAAKELEGQGVMNIDATSTFETPQGFVVTANGTMNLAGKAKVAGTLTNNGSIVLTAAAATLTADECGNVTTNVADHKAVYADGAYGVELAPTDVKVATLAELQAALEDNSNELPIIITTQIVIPEGTTVELDLNGKTVNSVFNGDSETNHIYALSNKGTLTINDSKGNGSINSRGIYNYGSLTLDAGAINAIDGNGGYAINNESGSTFVMNGGVVAATYEDDYQNSSGGYDATALDVPAGCTATLNGGTINNVCDYTFAINAAGTLNIPATSTITVNGTHGAIAVSGGTTTIDAGTFQIPADEYVRTDNVLYVTGGSLVVNGGTFIGDSDTAASGSCLCDEAGKAVVNGGTFKGSSGGDVWGKTGTTIKGGTFENLTQKQYIAAGYELNEGGAVVKKAAATINGVKYASLGEAVAKLKSGETLVITSDITPGANEFIELNGKTNVTLAAAEGVVIDGNIQVGYHLSHIDNGVDRSASTFTVDGLTVNGTLTVCSNDAALVVKNTKAAQITVKTYREGMDIALNGNIADGSMGTAANSYGMFLVPNETGYNLAVDGNTFQNINSHAFVVQGCGDGSAVTAANSIAVTNNNFETWGTGGKADRAAFKIWADTKYAPAESDLAGTTNAMRELVIAIAAGGNKYLSTAGNTVQFDAYGAAGDAEDFPKPMYAVVKIGEQGYATLAEAVDAATDGATITLLQNVELASTVTVAGKAITLDLNGKTVSGTCNAGQSSLVYIENNAALTVVDSSDAKNGKLTYAKGTSNVGWTVDVKGAFTLEAGTVELTGSDWSIGYAVDVRPNSWGTEYTNPSVFTMNGGKLVSSDGAVRVASSSAEGHKNVAASFVMNGGAIDAVWDGVFVQQSNATYDVLSFTMNGGTIESDLNPVRVYGPAATGYVNGADCMNISFNGGTMTYTGTETREWVIDRILRVGGGSSMETILESGNITATEAFANANALPEGYQWVADGDKYVAAFVPKVAKIGETYYTTLDAAVKAAQAGETVVVLENVEVASGTTITLDGVNLSTLDGVTLTNNGAIDVKGEVSLNIVALAGEELNLLDGAIVKNSTVGGSAFVAGAVTFRGANTFAMLYDFGTLTDYYGTTAPMKWIVEEGASVTLTDKARYGLGYGDNVTVNGNIENALAARETVTEADRSLFVHGLVAQESKGWNCNSAMTVKDAYVVIGSNNSFGNKPGNYGGTYTFNFENSVVDASRITFYEALSTTTFTFDGCDVKMGTFMTRDADSKFTLKNSKVLSTTTTNGNDEGNYNKGELTLVNSSLTYSAELKHEDGVINLDCNSVLTAPAISGAGKITVDATGLEGTVTVINGDMANFTGTIEIVGNEYASYSITAEGLVVVIPKVAAIGETAYPTLQAAIEAAQAGETITMLCDVELASAVTIPAGKVVTLDLNGKTVSYTSAVVGEDMITNNGNLTIDSSVEGGKITYNNTDVTGQNVTISTISACPGSTLVVNGGTIENTSVGVSSNVNVAYTIDILTNGSLGNVAVTINGGSVVSTNYIAIRQFNNGTACKNSLTINDGHIYGAKRAVQVHLNNNAAVTAINGGKVEAGEGGYALCNFAATSALEVTGGELIGAVYSASEGFITGGTFSEEPYSGYIAEHYEAVLGDNGYYGIEVEEGYIAELEITYGTPFENSSVKEVGKLTYNRTINTSNVGKWQPLYIPFPAPVSAFGDNVEIATPYDVNATDENGDGYADGLEAVYLLVNKGATLRANYPYMIKVNDEASCEISVVLEDVTLSTSNEEDQNSLQCGTMFSDFIFAGSYNTLALDASLERTYETQRGQFQLTDNEKSGATILSMSSGTWYKNTTQDIAAHRVYIVMYNFAGASYISENAMKSIGVRIIGEENEDGTTVIYDVYDEVAEDMIFDLQGRRVLETEKGGIYIKNGKKFIAQ